MIEKVTLQQAVADSNVIEAIRSNMPVATLGKAGLANDNVLKAFNYKKVAIGADSYIDIGRVHGLLSIVAPQVWNGTFEYRVNNFTQSIETINDGDYPYDQMSIFTFEWGGDINTFDSILRLRSKKEHYICLAWQELVN